MDEGEYSIDEGGNFTMNTLTLFYPLLSIQCVQVFSSCRPPAVNPIPTPYPNVHSSSCNSIPTPAVSSRIVVGGSSWQDCVTLWSLRVSDTRVSLILTG